MAYTRNERVAQLSAKSSLALWKHSEVPQAPFVSISLGLDTSKFGKMITEEYLKVHMDGLGEDHTTPVFPKVIFFLEDGVNMKQGDPNYDLKKLAIDCAVKRIYPDFISVPLNRKITGVTGTPVTSMGKQTTAHVKLH